ncbi:unnamed protein product [Spirodela intermedia]|uniref:Vacuolar iron transporter n=1 Tax=Spirodela intermedia TaxID=51605 RepID=A0A7I8JCD3_SPIIN|nr:unnamed protein product [Spirodela intermedia]CAA6667641.1 unnamed protein product [Spirodela intermedia]
MACTESKLTIDGGGRGGGEDLKEKQQFDYSQRAQWLRAAVLGANDGLVSTASMMVGVGAVKTDVKSMVLTGFAGLVAGACSMAIGEFVSVHSQVDRPAGPCAGGGGLRHGVLGRAAVPLLAAGFIGSYRLRLGVVSAAATAALVAFGVAGAVLGGVPAGRSAARVVAGGWLAMAVTFGLMKAVGGFAGL